MNMLLQHLCPPRTQTAEAQLNSAELEKNAVQSWTRRKMHVLLLQGDATWQKSRFSSCWTLRYLGWFLKCTQCLTSCPVLSFVGPFLPQKVSGLCFDLELNMQFQLHQKHFEVAMNVCIIAALQPLEKGFLPCIPHMWRIQDSSHWNHRKERHSSQLRDGHNNLSPKAHWSPWQIFEYAASNTQIQSLFFKAKHRLVTCKSC